MSKIFFEIEDDVVVKYTPTPIRGDYKVETVMTKEIFQECYKKWIEQQESEEKRMDRLTKTISDVAFILDNLILLRQIQSKGDCNNCINKDCKYEPKAGQMVRYNCPFYKSESENKLNETNN